MSYEIVRDKQRKLGTIRLENKKINYSVVTNVNFETPPSYLIFGGLLFEPLTNKYILSVGGILNSIYEKEGIYKNYKELVVLVRVLPFDVNLGYSDITNKIIVKVNGEPYKDFKDFVQKVKNTKKEFIIFETDNEDQIVLDVNEVESQKLALMNNYSITSEMSDDVK